MPILSVITNIGLEHTSLLGDTLPKIAAEKAGIIKKSIPVIIGEADARYNGVIEQAAAANKSRVIYAEQEFSCEEHHMKGTGQSFRLHRSRDGRAFDVSLDLQGNYQSRNIVTASAAVDFLHEETPLTISRRAYLEGMRCAAANTALMGRWQTLAESPLTVCRHGPQRPRHRLRRRPAESHAPPGTLLRDRLRTRQGSGAHPAPAGRATPTTSSRRPTPSAPSRPPN